MSGCRCDGYRRAGERLRELRERRDAYVGLEGDILSGKARSYTIGSRSISRYEMSPAEVRAAIRDLDREIAELEARLCGRSARGTVFGVPRDR